MKHLFRILLCSFFTLFFTFGFAQEKPGLAQYDEGENYRKANEFDKAIQSYIAAAELGYNFGLLEIGDIYKNNKGDYVQAANYYNKFIESLFASCEKKGVINENDSSFLATMYHILGGLYVDGKHGLEINVTKAIMNYERARNFDSKDVYSIGTTLHDFGCSFLYGVNGFEEDEKNAVILLKKAYDYGYVLAAYELGECYMNGWGVEENDEEAFKYYRIVVGDENEHVRGMRRLGLCYYGGVGTEKDLQKAVFYFNKAALRDDTRSMRYLAQYYEDDVKDLKKAFYWMSMAAENGLADAQNDLGWYYEMGKGVEEDEAIAIKWYQKAAEQGHKEAIERLKELEEENKE